MERGREGEQSGAAELLRESAPGLRVSFVWGRASEVRRRFTKGSLSRLAKEGRKKFFKKVRGSST